jgi:hypothetical protein
VAAETAAAAVMESPEARLSLACARIEQTSESRHRVQECLANDVDWPRLLALAEAHGLLALLFRSLQDGHLSRVPSWVETRLWTYQEQLRRKNQAMLAELLVVVELLESSGVPVVPFKGPVLAQAIYGNLELREFGDLDFLLSRAQVEAARRLLAQRGYEPMFPLPPALDRAMLASPRQYHVALKCQFMLELHWKNDAEFVVADPDEPNWWSSRPMVLLGARGLRTLEDRETVLLLLLHGSKHLWEQLNWVAEVSELIRQHPDLDWIWILERADSLRARRRVAVGLRLAQRYFDLLAPPPVEEWVGSVEKADAIAQTIAAGWFSPDGGASRGGPGRLFMNMNLYDSGAQRVLHVIDVLRPGIAEWTAWPLPRTLHALYLPIRAARLAGKYLGLTGRG